MENCLFSGWPQEEADCSQCDTAAPVLPWLPPPHASASFQFHGFPSWSVPVERISGEDDRSEERTATASKSHSQAEKRRRDRINAQLATLRKLIPKSEKMDKAALLGSVIDHVKDLKRKAMEVSNVLTIPTEVDEVSVECEFDHQGIVPSNPYKENIFIKASVCCEDRPELFSELIRALQGLKLTTVRADMACLSGRTKIILVLCSKDDKETVCITTLKQSLKVLQAKYQHVSRSPVGVSQLKVTPGSSSLGVFESKRSIKHKRWDSVLLVADDDQIAAETSEKSSGSVDSEVQVLTVNPSSLDSSAGNGQFQTNTVNESEPQTFNSSKGSTVSSDMKQETGSSPGSQGNPKRSPLTARERLRAARVLGRYTETTSSKPELGSKVLDALRASDGGKKKSGLPEAPTNLFDDSKRGLPKQGLTFQFPGGSDLFFIAFSFVFISTVMFATTYIVWKAGAIHFNEY